MALLVAMHTSFQIVLNEKIVLIASFICLLLIQVGKLDYSLFFFPVLSLMVISLISFIPVKSIAFLSSIRRWVSMKILATIPKIAGIFYEPVWANTARVVGRKLDAKEKAENDVKFPLSEINPGDLVISNLSNILEILVYESLCPVDPVYVFPWCGSLENSSSISSDINFVCHSCSFWSAVSKTLYYEPFSRRRKDSMPGKPLVVILEEAKKNGQAVILFVEGVCTNGSGVLEYPAQIFQDVSTNTTIHLSGFVYSSSGISPACPAGSMISRLFWLCSSLSPLSIPLNFLSGRHGVPKLVQEKKSSSLLNAISEKRVIAWVQELREVFGKLVSKKLLKLSLVDYDSFFEYYTANSKSDVKAAKKISDARGGKKL